MKTKFNLFERIVSIMAYKTKQREQILEYIRQNADSHLTADNIAAALHNRGVSKTTVYRHLEKLYDEGQVRKYILQEGKSACYQYAGGADCHSHFHLKCLECNCLLHLECDYLTEIGEHISEHHGFCIDSSRTVFYGLCEACARKKDEENKQEK